MAEIVGGFTTSHASAFLPPERWDGFRKLVRDIYLDKYGEIPDEPEQVGQETQEDVEHRYARISDTQALIRERIAELRPDAVIVLGNDQNENFRNAGIPQFAVYTGTDMIVDDYLSETVREYPGHREIALAMLEGLVEQGFDVVQTSQFEDNTLKAHAHAQPFVKFIPDADIPVIPVFVNAITPPMMSVGRCFDFGGGLRRALGERLPGARVIIGSSGGLSHFTAGYPYSELKTKRQIGEICGDFDRKLIGWMEKGELERFRSLTDDDLLENGDVEFRQSLAFFGALPAGARPERLEYEVLYRGLIGFWAGYWSL